MGLVFFVTVCLACIMDTGEPEDTIHHFLLPMK